MDATFSSFDTMQLISVTICCMAVTTLNISSRGKLWTPKSWPEGPCWCVWLCALSSAAQIAAAVSLHRLLQQRRWLAWCTWRRVLPQVVALLVPSAPSVAAAHLHSYSLCRRAEVFPLSQCTAAAIWAGILTTFLEALFMEVANSTP
jgi:hypothetical protein